MPQSARLILLALCVLGMVYVAYTAIDTAMTEQMKAEVIRGIYKQSDTQMKSPGAMGEFLQKRLHESYQRKGSIINSAKDKPDQTMPVALDKTQMIEMTAQRMGMITLTKYDHKLIDIKFTDDKQYAYVSSTELFEGTFNVTLPGNKKVAVPFNEATGCIDTWMPSKKILMMVRSECTDKMAFLQ